MKLLRAKWLWTGEDLFEDGAVLIDDDGNLASVGHVTEAAAQGAERADLGQAVLMPGMVNAHSHAFQRVFRGHVQWRGADQDSFWSWREAMYQAANSLNPEEIEAVSRDCFAEMASAGITHVGEFHYLHRDRDGHAYGDPDELAKRVIRAARDVGLRITLLRVIYGAGGVGEPLRPEQRRFRTDSVDEALTAVERLRTIDDPLVTVGVAPHSVRAVPREWLPELADFDGPIHAHVAEQPQEVADCRRRWGMSPLQVFAEAGLVDERFTAVHLTHPDAGDAELLRDGRAGVCACPTTEMDLGDGFLPLELRDDISLSVGSDSHARIDLLAEVRALEWHARALAGRRNVMSPNAERHRLGRASLSSRLLQSATAHGSAALGGAGLGLRPGQPADLCALDLSRLAARGVPPLEAAVFGGGPEWVCGVWVQGRQLQLERR